MPRYFCVYLLAALLPNKKFRTYIGSTNHFARRLRQHNGFITGGARTTKRISHSHRYPLFPILIVQGFSKLAYARAFEWRAKHIRADPRHRWRDERCRLLHPRVRKILTLLHQKKWTRKCPDSTTESLRVVWFPSSRRLWMRPRQTKRYLPNHVEQVML